MTASQARLMACLPGAATRTIRRLAHDAGLSSRTAIDAAVALVQHGLVEVLADPDEPSNDRRLTLTSRVSRTEIGRFQLTTESLARKQQGLRGQGAA